jgi:acetolactate synthase-1/2/3 large subunit
MGPVLIDVPMDVQQAEVSNDLYFEEAEDEIVAKAGLAERISKFFLNSDRPLVLFGAGVGLAGQSAEVLDFIESNQLPFVSSWHGASFFNHESPFYCGSIGVYGNRGANFLLQSCDSLLVLGSRLDNRQRGNVKQFASNAKVLVVDIDQGELDKHHNNDRHEMFRLDLATFGAEIDGEKISLRQTDDWGSFVKDIKNKYFGVCISTSAEECQSLSPYEVVEEVNRLIAPDSIVTVDTGACLCWVYQAFQRTKQSIFTAGGNSPMGYSLPAAIGAALLDSERQIVCFIGDGGFQMNVQELQTMKRFELPIKLFVMNNFGYGIIKQFQDTWLDGRYEATGRGYSQPDIEAVVTAYGLKYVRVGKVTDIKESDLTGSDGVVFDVILHPNTLIEPKIDSGNPLHLMSPQLHLPEGSLELKYFESGN